MVCAVWRGAGGCRYGYSLNWLLGDHLGSTSMAADASGEVISEVRYTAFGETRYENGVTPTDYRYTGQREEAELGLYYYVARWYDPALGRFTQADTIVPNPGSAKAYDRYAYVSNNPLKYTDPSGHGPCEGAFAGCKVEPWPEDEDGGGDGDGDGDGGQPGDIDEDINNNNQEVIVIASCGWDVPAWQCPGKEYFGFPIFTWLYVWAEGNEIKPFGTCTSSTSEGCINDIQKQANEIAAYMRDNPNALFFFVGHSSGATAVILALYQVLTDGSISLSQIGGAAVLDPYVNPIGPSNDAATYIANALGNRIHGWNSNTNNPAPNFGAIPNTIVYEETMNTDNHYVLITDQNVQKQIIDFFGSIHDIKK